LTGRRVAVTGLGAISALGQNVASLWPAIRSGECGIRPITGVATGRLSVRTAAQIAGFVPEAHFEQRRLGLLDRASQLALVAAREALAGIPLDGLDRRRGGVVLGAGIGQETLDAAYLALFGEGAKRLHPFTVPRSMPNAPASQISLEFGLRGPCFATASACASGSHAIGLAFHMVRTGLLDLAVTGGTDASVQLGYLKAWEGLRVLSPDVCRPFSRDRAGLVIGEGAGVLVLEDWDRARDRGAVVHAEMLGFGMSADARDMTVPDAGGAAQAMQAALDDAGLPPEAVDYVNAHGTGTRLNDRTEAAALHLVFGPRAHVLPVSSSKSMLGHCLCAGGALEMILTLLALRDGVLPPTIGFREADPDCPIDCVPNVARDQPLGIAMSNSFAFGGLNAVLVAGRAPA
jgi:nodulation protein E